MGLETGTFIDDLVTTNPAGTDLKTQGDDHIRLLKTILKATFPRAGKAFYFPQNLSKTVDYVVVAADDKSTLSIDTTAGAVTLTLPTLASGDAGWSIEVIKTNTGTNPVFIAPPSGTLNGFSKIRRTLEFLITKVVWNGSAFFASRPNGNCVGGFRDFAGSVLPNDCLWPDGTTFTAASFVELNSALGGNTRPDLRGRVRATKDNVGGSNAARIGTVATDSTTIVGTTLLSSGGSSTHAQTVAELINHAHSYSDPGHTHGTTGWSNAGGAYHTAGGGDFGWGPETMSPALTGITINATGSSVAMAWLQPTIIVNTGLVAE